MTGCGGSSGSGGESNGTVGEPERVATKVFFSTGDGSDCSVVEPFGRFVGADLDPVEAALEALVAGPTAEESAAGAGSAFSTRTADVVSSITLDDGLLVVDFANLPSLMPNASTSCGSEALLASLNSTVFQFPDVERVRYRNDESCDGFANWLQRECFDVMRTGEMVEIPIVEQAGAAGCISPDSTLPDGRWFGFVADAAPDDVEFDLACWFTGTAAASAAGEDGEESPPPNDYYIRNDIEQVRRVPVDAAAQVRWLADPGDPASAIDGPYTDWLVVRPGRLFQPGIWLVVADGTIVLMEEQYVP